MDKRRITGILAAMALVVALAGGAGAAAGDMLWQKQFSCPPDYNTITISAMAASATSFFISGMFRDSNNVATPIGFLKAFNAATGAPIWSKKLTIGANSNSFGSLIVDGNLIIARGAAYSYTQIPPNVEYTLARTYFYAYHVDTGKQVWKTINNFETTSSANHINTVGSFTTILVNNRLFLYAFKFDPNNGTIDFSNCIIRAYQVQEAP